MTQQSAVRFSAYATVSAQSVVASNTQAKPRIKLLHRTRNLNLEWRRAIRIAYRRGRVWAASRAVGALVVVWPQSHHLLQPIQSQR